MTGTHRGLPWLAALLISVLAGCGDDDDDGAPGTAAAGSVPNTERPQLAFFTTHPDRSDGVYDLAMSDDRGMGMEVLTGGSREGTVWPQLFTRVSWSPNGERVAFVGGPGPLDATLDERNDVYAMNADGSDVEQVTELGDAVEPVWSPDGEKIVFTRLRFEEGEPIRGDLWSIEVDGGEPVQLTEAVDWQADQAGSFTPAGSRLAFTRTSFMRGSLFVPETSAIYIADPDGSDEGVLLEEGSEPAFSPDGERLAFVSDRDDNGELCYGDRCFSAGELYVADADGGDPERLTGSHDLNEASPSWLRDGSRIAYQRGRVSGNAEVMSIFEVNLDGTCGREIVHGSDRGAWYASPAWRPSVPREGGGTLSC